MVEVIAEIRGCDGLDGLHKAFRARAEQVGISRLRLDEIAGFPSGYAGKLLAPEPMKWPGRVSFGPLLGGLGLKLLVVEDTEAVKRIAGEPKARWWPRQASPTSIEDRAAVAARMSKLGRRGGPARSAALSAKRRRAIARKAARARWRAVRSAGRKPKVVA